MFVRCLFCLPLILLKNKCSDCAPSAQDGAQDTQDVQPGVSLLKDEWPFSALGPFLKNGEPYANAIVFGQETDDKGNSGKATYPKKSIYSSEFKSNSDTEEKHNIAMRGLRSFEGKDISFYRSRRRT